MNHCSSDKTYGTSNSRKEIMCYNCDKLGHTRSFNIKYLKGINIEKGKENKGVSLAVVVVIDVYIVCDDGSINLTC